MGDRRMLTANAIHGAKSRLLAALLSRRVVAYAVEHDGHTYTALGFELTDGVVPLALLLPDDEWSRTPHRTDDLYAAQQAPPRWN